MTRVFNREKTFLDPLLRPIEELIYRLTGVDENQEMRWTARTLQGRVIFIRGLCGWHWIRCHVQRRVVPRADEQGLDRSRKG